LVIEFKGSYKTMPDFCDRSLFCKIFKPIFAKKTTTPNYIIPFLLHVNDDELILKI